MSRIFFVYCCLQNPKNLFILSSLSIFVALLRLTESWPPVLLFSLFCFKIIWRCSFCLNCCYWAASWRCSGYCGCGQVGVAVCVPCCHVLILSDVLVCTQYHLSLILLSLCRQQDRLLSCTPGPLGTPGQPGQGPGAGPGSYPATPATSFYDPQSPPSAR